MFKTGIIEPVKVKEQAIESGFEATAMILRIDVIIAKKESKKRLRRSILDMN